MDDEEEEDEEIASIYSLEDDNKVLNNLGKMLTHWYGRTFYKQTGTWRNIKEIAKKIKNESNPRIPNALGWKKKLLGAKLIKIEAKLQRRKGHTLDYLKSRPFIIITKEKELAERLRNDPELQAHLKRILKLSCIGIATFGTFMITDYPVFFSPNNESYSLGFPSFFFPLAILSFSLILLTLYKKRWFTTQRKQS